jgi:hypothetical protein
MERKPFFSRLKALFVKPPPPAMDRNIPVPRVFSEYRTDEQMEEARKAIDAKNAQRDECENIAASWINAGITLVEIPPTLPLFSGQESAEGASFSLDHKEKTLGAGVWLSKELMYASAYTDFVNHNEDASSKAIFHVAPKAPLSMIAFPPKSGHPAGVPRNINGMKSDLYIAKHWEDILNIIVQIKPEFASAQGHIRDDGDMTSEYWLKDPTLLDVKSCIDVSNDTHINRARLYPVGTLQGNSDAFNALFSSKKPEQEITATSREMATDTPSPRR